MQIGGMINLKYFWR